MSEDWKFTGVRYSHITTDMIQLLILMVSFIVNVDFFGILLNLKPFFFLLKLLAASQIKPFLRLISWGWVWNKKRLSWLEFKLSLKPPLSWHKSNSESVLHCSIRFSCQDEFILPILSWLCLSHTTLGACAYLSVPGADLNEPRALYLRSLVFHFLHRLAFQLSAIIYEAALFHARLSFHRYVVFACSLWWTVFPLMPLDSEESATHVWCIYFPVCIWAVDEVMLAGCSTA